MTLTEPDACLIVSPRCRFQVPPADLEAVLLTKDDIADVCVIGVESEEQATELPR